MSLTRRGQYICLQAAHRALGYASCPGQLIHSHHSQLRARVLFGPTRGMSLVVDSTPRPSFILGCYERHVTQAIRRYVAPGSVAIDVGANIGYHTLALARAVGPHGRVVCFEPDFRARSILATTLVLNRCHQAEIREHALSDRCGTASFASYDYSLVSHIAGEAEATDVTLVDVPLARLDCLVSAGSLPPPAFLKVDIEGHELAMLNGARSVLRHHRPIVVVEVRPDTARPVCNLLAGLDYKVNLLASHSGVEDLLCLPE